METVLGRPLLPTEIVHHKDEDKANNASSNLELTTKSEHGKHHAIRAPLLELTCLLCKIAFARRGNHERGNRKKGKKGPFLWQVLCG